MISLRKRFTALLVAMLAIAVLPQYIKAQSNGFRDVEFQVMLKTADGRRPYAANYYRVKSEKKAKDIERAINDAIAKETAEHAEPRKYVIPAAKKAGVEDFLVSANNGQFKVNAEDGMAVVIYVETEVGDQYVVIQTIKRGKDSYEVEINDFKSLQEVVKTHDVTGPNVSVVNIDTGDKVTFKCGVNLPKGTVNEDCRLVIQPVIVECQTEDTIQYADPAVFEGFKYHTLQNKRMGFDYYMNDPVARFYNPTKPLMENATFSHVHTVEFKKPEGMKDMMYKGAFYVTAGDYTHIVYDEGNGIGSCRAVRPFKYLNFSETADLELNKEEFYEPAQANVGNVQTELKLTFVTGRTELTNDSINSVEFNRLADELRSYGDQLYRVEIEGAASAEGNAESNKRLAKERANKADNMVQNLLRGTEYRRSEPKVRVFTWGDVANTLESQGDRIEATKVREIYEVDPTVNHDAAMKELPFYESMITPILNKQRVMKCSYQYMKNHVFTPAEVKEEYLTHKEKYLSKKHRLSAGDYFNLFQEIKDSLELDTLTDLAYEHISSQMGYEMNKFSPYIANRKAMLQIRRGKPDMTILRPFLDIKKKANYKRKINSVSTMTYNRDAHLLNQAIMMFLAKELDTIPFLLGKIQTESDIKNSVSKFFDLQVLYFKDGKNAEESKRSADAYSYVVNASEENKAILYAELFKYQTHSFETVDSTLNKLPDDNPKKWYLKGLLWANNMEKEKELKIKVGDETVPAFLAFFQHSFDMDKQFLKDFYNEGSVDDDTRKKHPYKKKNAAKYRNKFDAIYSFMNPKPLVALPMDNDDAKEDAEEGTTDAVEGTADAPAEGNETTVTADSQK